MRKLIFSLFLVLALAFPAHAGMTQYFVGGYYSSVTTDTLYNAPMYADLWNATEANRYMLIPASGTLKNLKIASTAAAAGNIVITVRNESGDTALAATITTGNSTGEDTSDTVSITAGDLISLSGVNAAANKICYWGLQFDLTDNNSGFVTATSTDSPSSSLTEYHRVWGVGDWQTLASNRAQPAVCKAFTAQKLYVKLTTAPGAGNSRTFTLVESGGDTGFTITVSGTDTEASNLVTTEAIAKGATLYWKSTFTGTPDDAGHVYIGFQTDTGTNGESILFGGTSNDLAADATEFNYLTGRGAWAAGAEANYPEGMMFETILKSLYVYANPAPGVGETVDIYARDDGSSVATCQIAGTDTSSEDTGQDTIAAGSKLTSMYTTSAGAATTDLFWSMIQYNAPSASGNITSIMGVTKANANAYTGVGTANISTIDGINW